MATIRKLAAIMFTDIVGYTAMMGKDEDKALGILRMSRKIQQSQIDKFGGHWLKEMGDGALVQFESAKQAVQCAIAIQHEAHEKLDAQIRVGIHLGDVTIENQDIFGDGVNISSRLQSQADPGGIYISESIHKAIRAIPEIRTLYLGDLHFKNVDYPVPTYAIQGGSLPSPDQRRLAPLHRRSSLRIIVAILLLMAAATTIWLNRSFHGQNRTPRFQSMAILPFENLTGRGEELTLIGMHDELISELGKIEALRVISKTSTRRFKDSDLSLPEIADQLGVEAIVETSVFQIDSLIRVRVNLVQAKPEEKQIWSSNFTRDFTHAPEVYASITRGIVNQIKVSLKPEEEALLSESRTVDIQAYRAYLTARSYWGSLSPESLDKALEYYELAAREDPNFAPAYGGIASVWGARQQMGFVSREEALPRIKSNLERALALDSDQEEVYYYQALIAAWTDWQWVKSEESFQKALSINPNMADAHAYYSHLLMCLKRPVEMKIHMDKALELDPFNPLITVLQAIELSCSAEYESAIAILSPLEKLAPNNPLIQIGLWMSYHYTGDTIEAFERQKKILEIVSQDPEVIETFSTTYGLEGYKAAILAAADLWASRRGDQFVPPDNIYWMYGSIGEIDKALEWLEIGYDTRDSNMPYIAILPALQTLRDHPAYQDLIRRLNLPLD